MTTTEQQIWDLVNEWCNEQSCEIPDFNRRALMDRILSLSGYTKDRLGKRKPNK